MNASRRPEPPLAVLDAMGQKGVPLDGDSEEPERRSFIIEGIAGAIRAEGKRRARRARWMKTGLLAALIAGAVTATLLWVRLSGAPSTVARGSGETGGDLGVTSGVVVASHGGSPMLVQSGGHIHVDERDEIRTGPDGAATLSLPRGVRIDVAPATKALLRQLSEAEQRIRVDIGEVAVSVPKPGGPRTVAITTPDSEVIVHGTEFTVAVAQGAAPGTTITSVAVRRGAVLVLHGSEQTLLKPGHHWSSGALSPAAPSVLAPSVLAPSAALAPAVVEERNAPPSQNATASRLTAAQGLKGIRDDGTLAKQNRLFQAALDARNSGDDAASLRSFDELLSKYPRTALEQEARLGRLRALTRLGRKRDAAEEARKYLSIGADLPARDEARSVILETAK